MCSGGGGAPKMPQVPKPYFSAKDLYGQSSSRLDSRSISGYATTLSGGPGQTLMSNALNVPGKIRQKAF